MAGRADFEINLEGRPILIGKGGFFRGEFQEQEKATSYPMHFSVNLLVDLKIKLLNIQTFVDLFWVFT